MLVPYFLNEEHFGKPVTDFFRTAIDRDLILFGAKDVESFIKFFKSLCFTRSINRPVSRVSNSIKMLISVVGGT